MKSDKSKIYSDIISFLKEKNASKIAVFGSFARNDDTLQSDIDIIVEFNVKKTLLDFIGMEQTCLKNWGLKSIC